MKFKNKFSNGESPAGTENGEGVTKKKKRKEKTPDIIPSDEQSPMKRKKKMKESLIPKDSLPLTIEESSPAISQSSDTSSRVTDTQPPQSQDFVIKPDKYSPRRRFNFLVQLVEELVEEEKIHLEYRMLLEKKRQQHQHESSEPHLPDSSPSNIEEGQEHFL